jgi:hypothetical protein
MTIEVEGLAEPFMNSCRPYVTCMSVHRISPGAPEAMSPAARVLTFAKNHRCSPTLIGQKLGTTRMSERNVSISY